MRALIERRVELITAPLDTADGHQPPEATLAAYALGLLTTVGLERGVALFRLIIESVPERPDLARAVFEAGVRTGRVKLAEFLTRETRAGRLAVPDPMEAANFFAGMVISHYQLLGLLGLRSALDVADIARIAAEASRRFMRAYAP